ncbi:MAG TPA: hypothetical protein VHC70_00730, partial [Phycisphaerales bacterium]|nr:hypothetical protein [Phycisphaerales bacterium]
LKEIERPGWRWTAIAGALGCAAAGACWLLADWFESFGSWTSAEPFFSSGWSLLVSGGMCAFALVGLGSPDRQLWRWIGVAGALAGASVAMYGSFVRSGGNPGWIVGPYCLGGFVAHAIVSLRMNLTRGQAWVRLVAIVAAACTGFSATYSVAIRPSAYDSLDAFDWTWRITSAFALVCASASMAMLVLGLLNRRPTVELSRTRTFDRVTVICPRCEKKLSLPLGGALCDGCRLHIDVTVHTARCAQCSYDLTGLTAAVCPECGAPIPQGTTSIASPAA